MYEKMIVSKIGLLYCGVFLEDVELKVPSEIKKLKECFELGIVDIDISIINITSEPKCLLNMKDSYLIDKVESLLKNKISKKSKKIIKYLEVLYYLEDLNFNGSVDNVVCVENKGVLFNYTEKISNRILSFSKYFLIDLMGNNDFACYYFLRDIIEDIKLYLYFIIVPEDKSYIEHKETIRNNLENEGNGWNYDIKKIIMNNQSTKIWIKEISRIEEYNNICNDYIHKNGFSKFAPNIYNKVVGINLLDAWYDTIKIYFILIVCLDGKSIASTDYGDYLLMDLEPLPDSQYSIASIFQDFISSEFDNDTITKMKEQSYMIIE